MDVEKYEIILIGIDKTGAWYLYQGAYADLPGDHWKRKETCICCP